MGVLLSVVSCCYDDVEDVYVIDLQSRQRTLKRQRNLIEAGFEYVTDINRPKLFRKLKTSYLGSPVYPKKGPWSSLDGDSSVDILPRNFIFPCRAPVSFLSPQQWQMLLKLRLAVRSKLMETLESL